MRLQKVKNMKHFVNGSPGPGAHSWFVKCRQVGENWYFEQNMLFVVILNPKL